MGEAKAGKATYSCARDPPSQTWSGSFSWMCSTENWNKWTGWARTEVIGTEGRERGQGGAVGERPGWGLRARAVDALNRWDVEQGVCRLCFTSWQISHRNFSLPAFQPQIQHVMDIWLHMSHERFLLEGHTSEAYKSETGNPQNPKSLDSGFLTNLSLPLGSSLRGTDMNTLCSTPLLFLYSGLGHVMKKTTRSSVVHFWVSLLYLVLKHKAQSQGWHYKPS